MYLNKLETDMTDFLETRLSLIFAKAIGQEIEELSPEMKAQIKMTIPNILEDIRADIRAGKNVNVGERVVQKMNAISETTKEKETV